MILIVLMVDGMFAVSEERPAVWFPDEDLIGLLWVDLDTTKNQSVAKQLLAGMGSGAAMPDNRGQANEAADRCFYL